MEEGIKTPSGTVIENGLFKEKWNNFKFSMTFCYDIADGKQQIKRGEERKEGREGKEISFLWNTS